MGGFVSGLAASREAGEPVFDRSHLQQYIEQNPQLEREIVELFLLQLPDILDHLQVSSDRKDWRLWTHTLKGSAMAVGARRIEVLATALEAPEFQEESLERRQKLAELQGLVAEFAGVARQLFS